MANTVNPNWTPPTIMDEEPGACVQTHSERRNDGSNTLEMWQKQHISKPHPTGVELRENWSNCIQRPAALHNEEAVRFTQQVVNIAWDGMNMRIQIQNVFGQSTNFQGPDHDIDHRWTTAIDLNMADYISGHGPIAATQPTSTMRAECVKTQAAPPPPSPPPHRFLASSHGQKLRSAAPPPRQQEPRRYETPGLFVTPGPDQGASSGHRGVYPTIENDRSRYSIPPPRHDRDATYTPPARRDRADSYQPPRHYGARRQLSPTPAHDAFKPTRRVRNTRPGGAGARGDHEV